MKQNRELQKMGILAENFQIPIWENSLQIPYQKQKHSSQLLLQETLFFTWVEEEKRFLIFVCIQSQLAEIFQVISLFTKPINLYLTSTGLIKEKISREKDSQHYLDSNYISSFLQELLEFACEKKITDIHLEPRQKKDYKISLRQDGILQDYKDTVPKEALLKVKLLSKMDIAKTRFPQDGHMNFITKTNKKFDLRISTLPAVIGEKMVIRILPLENLEIDLTKLNFNTDFIQVIKNILQIASGWIIVAGATGSGKTTTLYSIVRELLKKKLNIITVEDPVEYRLEGITQVEVKEEIGLTFASILRSSLRQDPDVILIGEIRDEETAKIASEAAKTGHLVLSTIHSGSVLETIQRLKSFHIPNEDLASTLKLLTTQKLFFIPKKNQRIPIVEYLENTSSIRNALLEKKTALEIEKIMKQQKFISLQKSIQNLELS